MVPMAVFALYQQSLAAAAGTVRATPTELSGKPERATKPWIFTIRKSKKQVNSVCIIYFT